MDWKKLTTDTKQLFSKFQKESPATFEGFGVMGKDAKKDAHLSEKTKEFIALGISVAVRCESCIGLHVEHLVRLGATRDEKKISPPKRNGIRNFTKINKYSGIGIINLIM